MEKLCNGLSCRVVSRAFVHMAKRKKTRTSQSVFEKSMWPHWFWNEPRKALICLRPPRVTIFTNLPDEGSPLKKTLRGRFVYTQTRGINGGLLRSRFVQVVPARCRKRRYLFLGTGEFKRIFQHPGKRPKGTRGIQHAVAVTGNAPSTWTPSGAIYTRIFVTIHFPSRWWNGSCLGSMRQYF